MTKSAPHQTFGFSYTCRDCGFKFTSNKNPQKTTLFKKSNQKIENHQVDAQQLNLKCPKCGSRELNLDLRKIYASSDDEKSQDISDSEIPVTEKQKVCVSAIEKVVGALSFFAGKITRADKVK